MADFWDVVKNRKSIRDFDSTKKVSDEDIEKIIEAGRNAPSAGNLRDFRFFVVESEDKKEQLAKAALNQMFIAEAPVVIVVGSDLSVTEEKYASRGMDAYSYIDPAMAAQNILLAATALGLGAVPIGAFEDEEVQDILGFGNDIRPVLIVPIGYAGGSRSD